MVNLAHLDYETRSLADIAKVGAFRYAEDPSTEIFCAAVARGEDEPVIWINPKFEFDDDWSPCLSDPRAKPIIRDMCDGIVYAHSAGFEAAVTHYKGAEHGFVVSPHQWRCTAAMARRAAIPASLEKAAECLGLTQQKDSKGKALIRKFSLPRKDGTFLEPREDPAAFRQFLDYCLQDVRVEQGIHRELKAFELTGPVLDTFQIDMDINMRGLTVNMDALRHVQTLIEAKEAVLTEEFTSLTGFNPGQIKVLLPWLQERGYAGVNLQAASLEEEFAAEDFDPDSLVGRVLTIKKALSYASIKKVKAMLACACTDGRVRGTLQFYGASTGRWSGRLMQPHNFKRPTIKHTKEAYADLCAGESESWIEMIHGPMLEVISSCIRHFIHDPEGPLYDIDFSAIEARILAWSAGEEWKLEVFRTHGKIYEATASRMTGVSLEEMATYLETTGSHHPSRFTGKVAELALGFQGAVGALEKMGALKMGALKMGLTAEELPDIVKSWRQVNPNIVKYWYLLENAVKAAIKSPGAKFEVRNVTIFCANTAGSNYLFIRLPSGRRLSYRDPRIEMKKWVRRDSAGEVIDTEGKDKYRECVTCFSQIPGKAIWGRVDLYAGLFSENITQAIAFDVMANGAVNAERAGFKIATLIHDQALVYRGDKSRMAELRSCLLTLPAWAKGLPIDAKGDIAPYYTKD